MKLLYIGYIAIALQLQFISNLAAQPKNSKINWKGDYELHLSVSGDSICVLNVQALFHSRVADPDKKEFTYFPVNLDTNFTKLLTGKKVDSLKTEGHSSEKPPVETLWNAVHNMLGGGWVHFVNCILYSFESNKLSLTAPLMQRPKTNWKPKPVTESWKRTHKWDFYVPVTQKEAIAEYNLLADKKQLQNLAGVPSDFITLFLNTTDKGYEMLIKNKKTKDKAKIDLVRLLLGSSYLGQVQINYIKGMVLQSVQQYSVKLPSVVVFDDLKAAVSMTLDERGYKIDDIAFSDGLFTPADELAARRALIENTITSINEANRVIQQQRLKNYFQ